MRLFSYVIPRDFGFAPNPFHGFCTLATCMPVIRRSASVNDWIIGTGSATYKNPPLLGRLVFVMLVDRIISYDQYWNAPEFHVKRPNLCGSLKLRMGDNIYHHDQQTGEWRQKDSHHTHVGGGLNEKNLDKDTGRTTNVLIAERYAYWGKDAIKIPNRFRNFDGYDIVKSGRGHKCCFPENLVSQFVEWFQSLGSQGFIGPPAEF